MNVRDLVPWSRTNDRNRNLPVPQDGVDPLLTLHREMNRLFDDAFHGFDAPAFWGARSAWPHLEVEDVEGEYRVTVELPGLEEKDVEVLVQDGVLVLRGEKRAETQDRGRAISERIYGRFERRLALDDVDDSRVAAQFRNGVLTITAPKSAQSQARAKRIPINQATTSH
ncbi:MAG: Hsp20/alpha crystallin family protein [Caulobacteraceae bacterium]